VILLHDQTRQQIEQAIAESTHALLLSGPLGSGKAYAAKHIAWNTLHLDTAEKLDTYPYFRLITAGEGSISIEQIRELQDVLKLKTPGKDAIRRVIIVEDAHAMTTEAQNALLKSLEEPPADTMLILTAPSTLDLKQTIYSRVQQIHVLPVTARQSQDFYGPQFKETEVAKAHMISNGRTGLQHAVLHSAQHPLLDQIQKAKQLIGATVYDRLLAVDDLAKHKDQLPLFLQACKLICTTAMQQAVAKADNKKATRWHHTLTTIHKAEASLPRNPNPKLLLDDLFLQM
jgi:hypothetical protein